MAASPALGSQPWQRGTLGSAVSSVQGLRQLVETISSWFPTWMVKERGQWRSSREIGLVAGIEGIQNISQDLFGQVGKGLAMFNLLRSDPSRDELCLIEAEPEFWCFLITGAHFPLGRCDCRGKFLTDLAIHQSRELVDGCCPGGSKGVVPWRWEELVRHYEIVLNRTRQKKKKSDKTSV